MDEVQADQLFTIPNLQIDVSVEVRGAAELSQTYRLCFPRPVEEAEPRRHVVEAATPVDAVKTWSESMLAGA